MELSGERPVWAWAAFAAFVVAMLALDLFVLHRRAQEVSLKDAGHDQAPLASARSQRRHARRPAELPPLHAAPLPSGELPAQSLGDHRADPESAARRRQRPLPPRRRHRHRLRRKRVRLADGAELDYDTLVLATGSLTNYYGNRSIESHALGLKDLGEALQLRNHVLDCLEQAAAATDAAERRRLLTFCIVGGGPTGSSSPARLAELVRLVLPHEYPEFPPPTCRSCCSKAAIACSDVQAASVEVRAARARAARRRRAHRHVRRVGRRRGSRAARRRRGRDGVDRLDRRCASVGVPVHPGVTRTEQERSRSTATFASWAPRTCTRSATSRRPPTARAARCRCSPRPRCRPAGTSPRRSATARRGAPFRYHDKGIMATVGRRAAVAQIGPDPGHRAARLGGMARRAPLLPDRLREPRAGAAALGLVLRAARPPRPLDPAGRPAPGDGSFARE